jgi:2-keto-4-pentenoate hydratase/2-oxohepta-3-ene-1,7-dioic acid hydratase in catechol pathway
LKFVVFGAERRLGMVHEERVLDLAAAALDAGTGEEPSRFSSLLSLIESGDAGLESAAKLLDRFAGTDQPGINVNLADTELRAPYPGRRFALAGANNAAHVASYYSSHGKPTTADEVRAKGRKAPAGGFWAVSDPVGPDADVPIPRAANDFFDYEGEVAVVLGKGGKRLRAEDAEDYIWGTVLVIDWSVRAETLSLPWYAHKNFDGSKSVGPWISVGEVDPMKCLVETRVNGEVRQKFTSGDDMVYSYAELLEQLSEDLTVHPGDLLSGGTGAGTAIDSTPVGADGTKSLDRFLKAGDTVEVSAPELGSLRGRVIVNN